MKKNIKIGSKITFLDSIDSTNNYVANLINEKNIIDNSKYYATTGNDNKNKLVSIRTVLGIGDKK